MYIIDWIGRPLCDRCFDWHTDFDGGPYQPDAIVRAERHITGVLRLPVPGNLAGFAVTPDTWSMQDILSGMRSSNRVSEKTSWQLHVLVPGFNLRAGPFRHCSLRDVGPKPILRLHANARTRWHALLYCIPAVRRQLPPSLTTLSTL